MEKTTIVLATKNPKKAEEIQRMVPNNIQINCLSELPEAEGISQAEETGETFRENALIKAKYWAKKLRPKIPNVRVLAEDSGLEIEALNGYPGVLTHRCVKELCPEANINEDKPEQLYPLLLKLMEESGNPSKDAKWVSAMAYVDSEKQLSDEQCVVGLMTQCEGEKAFGFDQYFSVNNKTLAQMTYEEKDMIGPRRKALMDVLSKAGLI